MGMMIERKKKLLMMQSFNLLPKAYRQIEYLESSKTQYIDTGLLYQKGDIIDVDVCVLSENNDNCVFGIYGAGRAELSVISREYFRFDISNANKKIIIGTKYHVQKNGSAWSVDGTATEIVGVDISTQLPCYLFGRNYDGANKLSAIRVYSYKHSRNNTELLNFIPCIRISDSKPGMYDTVSKTFYTNAGTGEFLVPTSINIIKYDAKYNSLGSIMEDQTDFCVTDKYYYEPSEDIRTLAYYGTTNSDSGTAIIYKNNGSERKDYWVLGEHQSPRKIINAGSDAIAFTLYTPKLNDSYAYIVETGQILFAGKNTQYYGHQNISELS